MSKPAHTKGKRWGAGLPASLCGSGSTPSRPSLACSDHDAGLSADGSGASRPWQGRKIKCFGEAGGKGTPGLTVSDWEPGWRWSCSVGLTSCCSSERGRRASFGAARRSGRRRIRLRLSELHLGPGRECRGPAEPACRKGGAATMGAAIRSITSPAEWTVHPTVAFCFNAPAHVQIRLWVAPSRCVTDVSFRDIFGCHAPVPRPVRMREQREGPPSAVGGGF